MNGWPSPENSSPEMASQSSPLQPRIEANLAMHE